MIELLEGVPGSGKSYHAVKPKLLAWVRSGRRVYVYVEGFYLDRLALFEGMDVQVLEKQITLWQTVEDVKAGLLTVEPGSAVFRAMIESCVWQDRKGRRILDGQPRSSTCCKE